MGKKKRESHPSLNGKKPINSAKKAVSTQHVLRKNPSHIANKLKRSEVYGRYLQEKSKAKAARKAARIKEAEALGEEAPPKATPRTLDNTREVEATWVQQHDEEVLELDESGDEFAPYFSDTVRPKILITTRPRPSQNLFYFIADLQDLIPSLHFYPRKQYSVKEICTFAAARDFTHLIVLGEKSKQCNGMTISHLRKSDDGLVTAGPTAFFRVTNVVVGNKIPHHGRKTSHLPELNLHGFSTRLGHRIGRFLGSLFPHAAELEGRQVVTFHNQRDYIFVRHHRYVFYEGKMKEKPEDKQGKTKARLQELGPRFTLRLRWLQEGTFDTQFGEYEWYHKRKEMDTTRRKFHL